MRSRWFVAPLAVVTVAVVTVAGCGAEAVGGEPRAERSAPATSGVPVDSVGKVDLPTPLELSPVTATDAEGRHTLAEPFLTVDRLESAGVEHVTGSQWVVELDLTEPDGVVFGDWTAAHIGEQVAVVLDGEVLFAPTISSAIPDGDIQIAGNYTRAEATDLFRQITGR